MGLEVEGLGLRVWELWGFRGLGVEGLGFNCGVRCSLSVCVCAVVV